MRPFHQSELEIIAASLAAEPPKEPRPGIRSKRILAAVLVVSLCGIFGVGVAFARAHRPGAASAHVRHARQAARLHRTEHGIRHDVQHASARPKPKPRAKMHTMLARSARAHHGARHKPRAHHNAKTKKPGSAKKQFLMRGALARLASLPTQLDTPAAGGPAVTLIPVSSGGHGVVTPSGSSTSHLFNSGASGSGAVQSIANQVQAAVRHRTRGTRSHRSASTASPRTSGAGTAVASDGSTHRHSGTGQPHKATHTNSPGNGFLFPLDMPPSQIEHIVGVVPEELWIALASALALAGLGTAAAVRSGRRARIQAGRYAAVAAVALSDPLTGVLNRRGFTQAVERELARASRHEAAPFVLAYIDVRGLKAVNDTEGHHAGDELLQQVAGLLTESVRAEDAVGRLGGDEFALLLTGPSARGAGNSVRRIRAKVPAHQEALGFSTPWDLTIGAAVYPIDGETFEDLLSTADREMYEQRGIVLR